MTQITVLVQRLKIYIRHALQSLQRVIYEPECSYIGVLIYRDKFERREPVKVHKSELQDVLTKGASILTRSSWRRLCEFLRELASHAEPPALL